MIQARRPTLVVVGTGMVGARLVEEVLTRAPDRFTIRTFGEDPHGTAVLAQDLMYDVPCDQLADALLPLVLHLPRK